MSRLALEMIVLTGWSQRARFAGMRWDELGDLGRRALEPAAKDADEAAARACGSRSVAPPPSRFCGVWRRLRPAITSSRPAWSRHRPHRPSGTLAKELSDGKATVHGFRASFSSWAAHRRVDHDVVEISLARDVGTAVSRRYNRETLLDHRRQLMAEWAAFLSGQPASASEGGEVIELPFRLRA